MADCGPSNALQQFKQQTSHDRTLQQDRLATRHAPTQGFRSADPRAGLLDPEFEAFQAGLPPSELPQYQHFQPPPAFAAPSQQQPAWAADFQRMQISPQPFAQQNNFHQAQAGPASANWAQGFQQHIAQNAPRAQQSSPSPQAFQQRARYGLTGFQSNFAQQPSYAAPEFQTKGKEPAVETFDAAAFEAAFDQARDDLMAEDHAADVESSMNMTDPGLARHEVINDILQDEAHNSTIHENGQSFSAEDLMELQGVATESTLLKEAEQDEQKTREDDDALAATAQELLEKIEHNQTDKFKNSQFLDLMRKLRDREMKVEGDKMVETATIASSSTTTQPLNSPSAFHTPRFDNSEQRPAPLVAPGVATQPRFDDFIPPSEQDVDSGRHVDPRDGQEVVDLLNERGSALHAEEIGTSVENDEEEEATLSSSPQSSAFYGDLRPTATGNAALSEMLYGAHGTLARPSSWRLGGGDAKLPPRP